MIHRELSSRIRTELEEPALLAVSFTRVVVTKDLSRAVVDYMPLGGGEVSEELEEALRRAAKALRGPIGRALRLRTAPELVFVKDQHTEAAVRVTSLLASIGDELRTRSDDEEEEG